MNIIIILAFTLASTFFSVDLLAASQKQNSESNCQLKLGWGNWPPYQSGPNQGKPKGIQIDLIQEIADTANCELTFVKNSFSENIQAIKNGDVDLIMDTSITDERIHFGYFSDPYRLEVLVLYLKPEYQQRCNNEDFLSLLNSDIKIGLNEGNIYGEEVTLAQKDPSLNQHFVYAENNDQLFELFADNKIDGFFEDPTVLYYHLRQMNLTGALVKCKVTQQSSTVSLMFSKKTTTLDIVQRFNEALAKVKKTKAYRANWGW